MVTEMSLDGNSIRAFSHDEFVEPIDVAINEDGDVLVADNGVGAVMVFESSGKLKKKIGRKGAKPGDFKVRCRKINEIIFNSQHSAGHMNINICIAARAFKHIKPHNQLGSEVTYTDYPVSFKCLLSGGLLLLGVSRDSS